MKTRIAKTAGDEKALAIYIELMKHTRKIALSVNVTRHLFYSQEVNKKDDWSNVDFEKHVQVNTDLGGRMSDAFKKAFEEGKKVIIVGSDCASLTTDIVEKAFKMLDKSDFVVGPTFDGGYYLLGMNSYEPYVFENIEWSTETVFSKTIERITELNKNYSLTETLSDIDFEEDWEKYGWKIKK